MSIPYSRYIIGSLPWYSTLIVIGAVLAILLASKEEKRANLPEDTVLDLSLRLLPVGIIGARIYYILFQWEQYRRNPVSMFYIWEGGLAIYGGLIAGFLCVIIFCKRRRIPLLTLCDVLIPGVALAQAIGRWGNYFNQEAYGNPITNPMLQFFPFGVQIPVNGVPVWYMATFFYESMADFGIFLFLIATRHRLLHRRGDVFFTYLFFYGAARMVVEEFRMDSLYLGRIRISQLISAALCAGIAAMFLTRTVRERKERRKRTETGLQEGDKFDKIT